MEFTDIQFGAYAMPVVLTALLAVIFKFTGAKIADRFKALIAVVCGMGLGMLGIFYKGLPITVVTVTDHLIYGFMLGCSAIGIYEVTRNTYKPRE
jgi:hypothetical protein